jgi:hypothetical protein
MMIKMRLLRRLKRMGKNIDQRQLIGIRHKLNFDIQINYDNAY